jgi:hypothetical protein
MHPAHLVDFPPKPAARIRRAEQPQRARAHRRLRPPRSSAPSAAAAVIAVAVAITAAAAVAAAAVMPDTCALARTVAASWRRRIVGPGARVANGLAAVLIARRGGGTRARTSAGVGEREQRAG